jgi:hypothetical protein
MVGVPFEILNLDSSRSRTFTEEFPGRTLLLDLITGAGSQNLRSRRLNIARFCLQFGNKRIL